MLILIKLLAAYVFVTLVPCVVVKTMVKFEFMC